MNRSLTIAVGLLLGAASVAQAQDFAQRVQDRTAVERVYYAHRLGAKPPFEQTLPPALMAQRVREDLHKEAMLRQVYGVTVTPAMVEAEVRRINATTRAPDILADLKHALGDDPARFACTVAQPIVVERTLRTRFENDDALHAPQRRLAEAARQRVLETQAGDFAARLAALKADHAGEVREEVTWELTHRAAEDAPAAPATPPPATEGKAQGGLYSVEATAQVAQTLSAPEKDPIGGRPKLYFEDLPAELQQVLRVQLRAAGNVSAVIELPTAFEVYLARSRTPTELSVAVLTVPKRNYETWLAEQKLSVSDQVTPSSSLP